jgi:5-methylthioadenosine/S-adenosylhomocysteine deaminase
MKQNVELLIRGGIIATMDPAGRLLRGGAVAIDRGSIVDLGDSTDLSERYEAREVVDASNAIVMPGLINTHAHLATAMFRGLAEDLPLDAWLGKVWTYETSMVEALTVEVSSRLAMLELIMGGVTCAVDMYWHPETTAEVARKAGFRLASGPVFIEGEGRPDHLSLEKRFFLAREFAERYSGDSLVMPLLMPHGTCTDSPELLARVRKLAEELDIGLNLHCAETSGERQRVLSRWGRTPVRLLNDLGYLQGRTILAHCVQVDEEEIALLAGRASVSHNPMSNLKLASGIAPLAAMARAGVSLSLGTDGSQSGNDLDMWLAMRLCAVLQKCQNGDATLFKAEDVLRMATIEAAKAIGVGDKVGSLELGKRADLIVVGLDSPHMAPLHDVYAQLVYAAGREDVRTVLIDGRVVLRNRVPTTIDQRESIADIQTISARIGASPA